MQNFFRISEEVQWFPDRKPQSDGDHWAVLSAGYKNLTAFSQNCTESHDFYVLIVKTA